jgi:D-aminopeptidase
LDQAGPRHAREDDVAADDAGLVLEATETIATSDALGFASISSMRPATLARVLEGDTMTATFTDFRSEGMPMTPDWVGLPKTSTRVK